LYYPWVPGFDCNAPLGISVPTWISLHALPLEFTPYAQLVASMVGPVFCSEDNNANSCIPKFCVGLHLDQGWVDSVGIIGHNGVLSTVRIDYVSHTVRCSSCQDTSHSRDACPETLSQESSHRLPAAQGPTPPPIQPRLGLQTLPMNPPLRGSDPQQRRPT
jgi:hypothetical protein